MPPAETTSHGKPAAAKRSTTAPQSIHGLPRLANPRVPVWLEHAMPFIALDAPETEARESPQVPCERDGLLGRAHAAAPHAHVDLDQDLQPAAGGSDRAVQFVAVARIIHRHGETALAGSLRPGPGSYPCRTPGWRSMTSSIPARLMTIASQTVAVQTPMAPAWTCKRASSAHL